MKTKALKNLISSNAYFTRDADNYYLYDGPNDVDYVEQLRLTKLIAKELANMKRKC